METSNNKKFIVDVEKISNKEHNRLYNWARSIMEKNESKFHDSIKNSSIVSSGTIEPEDPDVGELYRFPDLVWYIYKENKYWSFILLSKKKLLFKAQFAKI